MVVKQKKLKLNYTVEEKGKEVVKGYSFEIANETTKGEAKEVGSMLATLYEDNISETIFTTVETI